MSAATDLMDDLRDDWNARPPLRTLTAVAWADRIGVSWHWIGPGYGPRGSGPHQACLDQVRDWQAQHQAKDWKDIGYNALICQHARAIEGRGLSVSGSHSPGVNVAHIGVQFMVGDDAPHPTDAMIARAVELRAGIGRLGRNIRRDWSHKDDPAASTECAGPWITNWVHTGGPTNLEDDDMPTVSEIWTTDLTKRGTIGGSDTNESPLDILTRMARNIETVAALERAQANASDIATAVVNALPTGVDIDPAELTAAFITALTKLAAPPEPPTP